MGKFLKVQNLETFETALKNLFNKKRFIHILKV